MVRTHPLTVSILLSSALLLTGCMATLVRNDVKRTTGREGRCAGSEQVDDSSLLVNAGESGGVLRHQFRFAQCFQRILSESASGFDASRQSRCVGQQDGLHYSGSIRS